MSARQRASVVDEQGEVGALEGAASSREGEEVIVRLSTGERIRIAAEKLLRQSEGEYEYHVQGAFRDFEIVEQPVKPAEPSASEPALIREEVIPVAEEELHVRKQVRETGRVRIDKRVQERTETVDEPLLQERVEVRRVPVDRVIDHPVSVRQEGDTMIIPVVEERLVVQKQLVLKEELHVTKLRTSRRDPQEVTLRSEEVRVERRDVEAQPLGGADEIKPGAQEGAGSQRTE